MKRSKLTAHQFWVLKKMTEGAVLYKNLFNNHLLRINHNYVYIQHRTIVSLQKHGILSLDEENGHYFIKESYQKSLKEIINNDQS